MLHQWCKLCNTSSNKCQFSNIHEESHIWKADFLLKGKRIRKYFELKKYAEAFEAKCKTDLLQSGLMPIELQSKLTFRELANQWDDKYLKVRLRNQGKAERSHLDVLVKFFDKKNIASLNITDGEEYIHTCIKEGKTPGGINRDISTLKALFNWAARSQIIVSNPFQYLKKLKEPEGRIRWLSKDEFTKFLSVCLKTDKALSDIILFGVMTGFRKQNLEQVMPHDISHDWSFITAQQTKSGKPYDVPITPELKTLLERLIKESLSGPLLKTANLRRRFQDAVKEAGLWCGARNANTVTLHTLRHTFASWYIQRGGDIYTLQKRLRHSSLRMTERYAHLGKHLSDHETQVLGFDVTPKIELKLA
jgi:integrase